MSQASLDVLRQTIPWVGASARGAAQEALARACAVVDYDPWDWTNHRHVLRSRLALIAGESSVSTLGDEELWDAAKTEILQEQSRGTEERPLVTLAGYRVEITVEDGYVKAYAHPPKGGGIVSYGLQGRVRDAVFVGVRQLIDEWIDANDCVEVSP